MDTFVVGSTVISIAIGLSYHMGYLNPLIGWMNNKHQKGKLLLKIVDNLSNPSSTKKSTSFTVNDSDISASIVYERMGTEYIVIVPYNRTYVAAMSQFKAELLRSNGTPVNITQQPGIPYLVTADELGGYAIKITNQETGLTHEYEFSKAPMYGIEVMDNE